jgi:hypothetical protein
MNLKTQKIIAREFLTLLIVIGLGLFGFLCTYPYNFYKNQEIGNFDKRIGKLQSGLDSIYRVLGYDWHPPVEDSLVTDTLLPNGYSLVRKEGELLPLPPPKRNLLKTTNSDTDKYGVPIIRKKIPAEKIYEGLINSGYNIDNLGGDKDDFIRHVQKTSNSINLYENLIGQGFTISTLGTKVEFLKAIKVIDKYWINRITLNNRTQKIQLEIKKLNNQKKNIEQQILPFANHENSQVRFGFLTGILSLILLFGFRYIFYAVRWSIKTLRQ